VRDLGRIVKDPWKDGPVEVDRAALVAELPAAEKVSVRLDPELEATTGDPLLGRPRRESDGALVFRRGRKETARVVGSKTRLDLLEEVLGGRQPDDLGAVLLPKDLDAFEREVDSRRDLVRRLLRDGRRLVEQVERLVCELYGLPADLTDEVVAHAVARAARSASPAE
jgi:hypothetical protein